MLNRNSNEQSMKPIVEISGSLYYELKTGYRAFIQDTSGESLMTSQVVDIRNETTDGVEIETQNTIYKLTYATVQTAA